MGFGMLGALGRGFGRLGASSGGQSAPTAPVLAMDPAWTTADNTPDFTIDVDDTVSAGDDVRLQVQASGGNWSSLAYDATHTITAGEDTANEIDLALSPLSNGDYEARAFVIVGGVSSSASNTVSFTIAAATNRLMWGADQILWATDNLTWS